ncbi:MAG: DUF6295 family protein [Actinomycetota bacterium]|nr:DUF6295 family protein [Actinomycetota bacterium]
MCTYVTVHAPIEASAKGPGGHWFAAVDAVVYFDHPVHASADHTLNIDLPNPRSTTGERVAIEMTAASARELMNAIANVLETVPAELTV